MKKVLLLMVVAGLLSSASFSQKRENTQKRQGGPDRLSLEQLVEPMGWIELKLAGLIRIDGQYSEPWLTLDNINPDLFTLFELCKRDFEKGHPNPIFGKMHGINEMAKEALIVYTAIRPDWDYIYYWSHDTATYKWGRELTWIIEQSGIIIGQ